MSIHQMLLGGQWISYRHLYTLLNTTATDAPIMVAAQYFSHVFYNGVVWNSKQGGGVAVGMDMFAFATQNTPIVTKTGLFPQRYCVGGAYGKSTPPGYGIYKEISASNTYYRINQDGVWEYFANGGLTDASNEVVWEDSQQILFTVLPSSNTIIGIESINWVAHTCTVDTTTYNTSGYADPIIIANGGLVDGRVYVADIGAGEIGRINAISGVFTSIANYANIIGGSTNAPILCSPDYLGSSAIIATQCGTTNQGNYIDFYNTADTLVGHVQLPLESNTTYGNYQLSYDYVNHYLFVKATTRAVYVIDMSSYTVVDTYTSAEMPDGMNFFFAGALGSPLGGIYIISRPSGVVYNTIYKLG
jgi:hypothetical protein